MSVLVVGVWTLTTNVAEVALELRIADPDVPAIEDGVYLVITSLVLMNVVI